MKLDEQVYRFYRPTIKRKGFLPPVLDVDLMRATSDMTFNDKAKIMPIYDSEDVYIPSPSSASGGKTQSDATGDESAAAGTEQLRMRIYTPHYGNGFPVLLYFHGGGFIMHNIESHDALCRKLAVTLGFVVVSVGYRLAPEHPYPAAIEDAEAAYRWVRESARKRHWDSEQIYAGGDSAGATISVALALKLNGTSASGADDTPTVKPEKASSLSGLLLLYGVYEAIDIASSDSCKAYSGGDYVLPLPMLEFCDQIYTGNADPSDPLLYPGQASDLSCLPPCVVVSADFDPLRDDGIAFADLLERSGVSVCRVRGTGMMHGFALYWYRFRKAEAILLDACNALING